MSALERRLLILVEGGDVPANASHDSYSGYIRYFRDSTTILQQHGYTVVFGTLRNRSPLHEPMEALGCSTFALKIGSARGYPGAAFELADIVRQNNIHLLHLHESICAAVGGLAARVARRPAIFHRHHTTIEGPKTRFLSFAAARFAHHVMAVSEGAAGYARLHDRVPSRRISVVHNGILTPSKVQGNDIRELKSRLHLSDDDLVIMTVGHLRPEKGYDVLVEALPAITRETPAGVHYVVVGAGEEEKRLQMLASSKSLNVHFCGHQANIWPWLAIADALVIPSHRESFGLVAVEAMASGIPVIAARTEGLIEVVEEGVSGLFFPPGDRAELSAAVTRLLADPQLRKQLSEGGRTRFGSRFTVSSMVNGWMKVYETLLTT